MDKDRMVAWIVKHRVTRCSRLLWACLMGVDVLVPNSADSRPILARNFDFPFDHDDLTSCIDLVKFCGVSESDMTVVVENYPFMSPFISRWGELLEAYHVRSYVSVQKELGAVYMDCLKSYRAIYLTESYEVIVPPIL